MQASLGLAQDRGQGLRQLMRHPAGHLAQHIHPRGMGQPRVLRAEMGLPFCPPRAGVLPQPKDKAQIDQRCQDDNGDGLPERQSVRQVWRKSCLQDQGLRLAAKLFFEPGDVGLPNANQRRAIWQKERQVDRRPPVEKTRPFDLQRDAIPRIRGVGAALDQQIASGGVGGCKQGKLTVR